MSRKKEATETLHGLKLIAETEKGCLFRGDMDVEEWIPKSQILRMETGPEEEERGRKVKDVYVLEIPRWLAKKKNL
jgi:hypothetical protein